MMFLLQLVLIKKQTKKYKSLERIQWFYTRLGKYKCHCKCKPETMNFHANVRAPTFLTKTCSGTKTACCG